MVKVLFELIKKLFEHIFGKAESNEAETQDPVAQTESSDSGETINNETEENQENMKSEMVILIDNGHGDDTPGKRSPWSANGVKPEIEFYEYKWAREIAYAVVYELGMAGYDARLLVPEINDISLKERVKRVKTVCDEHGTSNVILVSIHANAAGKCEKWMSARGWSAYTTKGKTQSDTLAECLYDEAKKNFVGQKIRKDTTDGDSDWEDNFYILQKTPCTAVLTENFFYDNVDDVQYILGEGREPVIMTHVNGIINYIDSL